jgi:hypothetical protein
MDERTINKSRITHLLHGLFPHSLSRTALTQQDQMLRFLNVEISRPDDIIEIYERFEVFTAVTMKNGVFWVVTPCGSW